MPSRRSRPVRTILVPRDLPRRDEPQLEGLAGTLKDRPGRHGGSATAVPTTEEAIGHPPRFTLPPAPRAEESFGPTKALQESDACPHVGEKPVEFGQVAGVVHAGPKAGCVDGHATRLWLRQRREYPLLEKAGVPRSVATKLTSHKTEEVYRRYAIADRVALEEGVEKLARLHATPKGARTIEPIRKEASGA